MGDTLLASKLVKVCINLSRPGTRKVDSAEMFVGLGLTKKEAAQTKDEMSFDSGGRRCRSTSQRSRQMQVWILGGGYVRCK